MELANLVHPDKTGYIVIGNARYQEQIKKELEVPPIMFRIILTNNMWDMNFWVIECELFDHSQSPEKC